MIWQLEVLHPGYSVETCDFWSDVTVTTTPFFLLLHEIKMKKESRKINCQQTEYDADSYKSSVRDTPYKRLRKICYFLHLYYHYYMSTIVGYEKTGTDETAEMNVNSFCPLCHFSCPRKSKKNIVIRIYVSNQNTWMLHSCTDHSERFYRWSRNI